MLCHIFHQHRSVNQKVDIFVDFLRFQTPLIYLMMDCNGPNPHSHGHKIVFNLRKYTIVFILKCLVIFHEICCSYSLEKYMDQHTEVDKITISSSSANTMIFDFLNF